MPETWNIGLHTMRDFQAGYRLGPNAGQPSARPAQR
jgi:hypothetical protein